jgi:lipopolysaccharide export system permease protein
MKVLQRYFAVEILQAVLFVLAGFLALFAFFDLMGELPAVGHGGYRLQHALSFVLLRLPGYVYELMPIAALIGSVFALSQFAARSEFTIMRASSMSTFQAGWMLAKIGLLLVIATFLIGEYVAPMATQTAENLKLSAQGASVAQKFRTGLWTKDVLRVNGLTGATTGTRFLNVREIRPDGKLYGVKLYEFNLDFRLNSLTMAAHAEYQGANTWRLVDVAESRFSDNAKATAGLDTSAAVSTMKVPTKDFVSEITPQILSVLFADPERMSAYDLAIYKRHLAENKQNTERYEIAFWKKLIYPFAVFVMMALALPFAYLHFRAGGVSLKIFAGIMIGVSFQLLNSLFSHLGLLNTWPALLTAILPSSVFLLAALGSLWWVERR